MVKVTDDARITRKAEHMSAVQTLGDNPYSSTWFEDVSLIPNCAPELAWQDVSLQTSLCGFKLASPIVINAMTGGTHEAYEINRKLATLAKEHGLAMAVGSETAALRNPELAYTYEVVREVYPEGIVIANVGLGTSLDIARAAVDLVGANMLQVHWNVAQELFMPEGDRDFRGALALFEDIAQHVGVPVIAKEVGQGVAAEQAKVFIEAGAKGVDIGGRGGTNFIAVEAWRSQLDLAVDTMRWGTEWGIATAASLCEVVDASQGQVDIIASGGMRTPDDMLKAMSLGASAVGVAGPFLRLISETDGASKASQYVNSLHWSMRSMLLMTGSNSWDALRQAPLVVMGRLKTWLLGRGMAAFLDDLSRRSR